MMITNMIVFLCLSVLFPVLMGADEDKSNVLRVKDCSDVYESGHTTSGVYTISTMDGPVKVYCEMAHGGIKGQGYWTVFLRRLDGKVNFYRPWDKYKWGFGDKEGEYWLGLEFLHQLTRRYPYRLRVDVEDFKGQKAYAVYKSFSVSAEADGYRLQVSGFVNKGAGDSLSYHNLMKFTTYDKDQDNSAENCAIKCHGGFWYNNCYFTNPTGPYLREKESATVATGINWYYWKNNYNSLKSITMKIKHVK